MKNIVIFNQTEEQQDTNYKKQSVNAISSTKRVKDKKGSHCTSITVKKNPDISY